MSSQASIRISMSPSVPPPYQPTTTTASATLASTNNQSSNQQQQETNDKAFIKGLNRFMNYKLTLGFCFYHACVYFLSNPLAFPFYFLFWSVNYLELQVLDPSTAIWFVVVPLMLIDVLAIVGVFYKKPMQLIPFIQIQLGGGFCLVCVFTSWFIYAYINEPELWMKAAISGFNSSLSYGGLLVLFIVYDLSFLLCYYLASNLFTEALHGMISNPEIHDMALRMFFATKTGVMDDQTAVAKIRKWVDDGKL